MTTQQIKSEIFKLIDSIEDDTVLVNFYEAFLEYKKNNNHTDVIDELSNSQKQRLFDSIQQVKDGKTMSNDIAKDEIMKWLSK